MLLYKILVPIVAAVFVAFSFNQFRQGKNTLFECIMWSTMWLCIAILAMFPDFVTDNLARLFGIKSNVNAIIFLALGVLFFIQYNLFVAIKRQNKVISELVKKLALKDEKLNNE